MKLLRGARRRENPVRWSARALLVSGAIVPTVLGAGVIAALTFWALPTGEALGERHVLLLNVVVAVIYVSIAIPIAIVCGYFWMTVPAGADERVVGRTLLAIPSRMAVIHGAVWVTAALTWVMINLNAPWLAATLGISTLLGGAVTTAMSYWLSTFALRPSVAELLTREPPTKPRRPGLRLRAVSAWALGTGVPLLMLMLVAASALVVEYPGHRLAWVVLAVGICAVVSGLVVAAFTGATTADPIDEVRRGMQRVERGDYEVTVPVFDASELGLLQAGFNNMAGGLREREKLRDLFGRHVGKEVARMALQNAPDDDSQNDMGGRRCEVAVLFVDLVGSSQLAVDLPPTKVVAILNDFFATVVEVVERNSGWVNKFEGDAALAVFGAPMALPDSVSCVLCTARELANELRRFSPEIRAGIGVSAGQAVAGYIGGRQRYEYTVIGDPVNEAARLSEVAKQCGGVVASGRTLTRAAESEAARWQIIASRTLRGRKAPTDIAIPR